MLDHWSGMQGCVRVVFPWLASVRNQPPAMMDGLHVSATLLPSSHQGTAIARAAAVAAAAGVVCGTSIDVPREGRALGARMDDFVPARLAVSIPESALAAPIPHIVLVLAPPTPGRLHGAGGSVFVSWAIAPCVQVWTTVYSCPLGVLGHEGHCTVRYRYCFGVLPT